MHQAAKARRPPSKLVEEDSLEVKGTAAMKIEKIESGVG
jgi:hypothetical protein